MKTVMLYGFLGKRFGRVHRLAVRSPAEAVRALSCTLAGFKQALIDGGAYRVVIGGKQELDRKRVADPVSDAETIRLVPVVSGAGRGLGTAILGAALIVAAPYAAGFVMANTAAVGLAVGIATYGPMVGASLVMSGVSQMLFSPKQTGGQTADRPENRPSFSFDGAVNTAAQGNPVAVCYGGPILVGSQVISAGLSVEQI